MIVRRLLLACSLLLAGAVPGVLAKSDGPEIKVKEFDHPPHNVYYFEDSDTVLLQEIQDDKARVHISTDAAGSWELIKDKEGLLWTNKFHTKSAYIIGPKGKHWVTFDAAKTWREFEIKGSLPYFPKGGEYPFTFHGKDANKVIINTQECLHHVCRNVAYYTTDGFKTVKKLFKDHAGCYWAMGSPEFGDGMDLPKEIEDRVFCIWTKDLRQHNGPRVVYSDKYFSDNRAIEAEVDGRAFRNPSQVLAVKKFLVVAARSERTSEVAIYVSKDATNWNRAEFYGGPTVRDGKFTVLRSTNYSLQVNVASRRSRAPMGSLFSSDSNGTSFNMNVDYVNEDEEMYTDFEQVTGIQGIFMVNLIDNHEEAYKTGATKKLVSRISFDDGRTFQPLKYKDKNIHLHSITSPKNSGTTFSSPAPGLVMGVGNTGDKLERYKEGNLYVSNDAGISWRKALDKAHKYEFGDQGSILVAVFDEDKDGKIFTEEISYSLNHGKDWKQAKLPHKVTALQLTTTPDSTSLQFLLVAEDAKKKFYVMSIDFSGLHERKCEKGDFERWPARLNEKGEPDCLMGHKQFYKRRKADADCFVKEKFKEPLPESEACKCTKEDFECAFGFKRDKDFNCEQITKLEPPEGQCKKPDDKYMGPSGYRMIPGNDCIKKDSVDLEKPVERICKETAKAPATGDITVKAAPFKSKGYTYRYLERGDTSSGNDETVILKSDNGIIFVTKDHGKNWKQVDIDDHISLVVPHTFDDDVVYLLTHKQKAYWSVDRGSTFKPFEAKLPPTTTRGTNPLVFHPGHPDWLIWTGGDDCHHGKCNNDVAYYSKNRGDEWHLLLRGVGQCRFIGKEGKLKEDDLVFCSQHEGENRKKDLKLLSSRDMFTDAITTHFDGNPIAGYAKMAEFIVVATKNGSELQPYTSVDGKTFAHAAFPPNFHVDAQRAYTVLDSSTHSVFLHVTENNAQGHEFGSVLKSNSNGTSFVLSLSGANRDPTVHVDFEKMQGIEGVALTNVVTNTKEVAKGEAKKLRTMITHNDGSEWSLLRPPKKDVEGKNFGCSVKNKGKENCALHLHGYTERRDTRDSLSSGSAVGLMIGIGNVGSHLSPRKEADTFMTRDAGITWHAIKKGRYQWEYGDQGSIIVLVAEEKPTKVLSYSLDEGQTWKDFEFSKDELIIDDISTVPSDTSRNFMLWGRESPNSNIITINVDFTGLKERERQCVLKKESPEADDYYLWSPKHPKQKDNCLFGHVSFYHRKRPEAKCYNGPRLDRLSGEKQNCKCTHRDYECDYNYERQNDGSCALVPGLQPADPKQICKEDPEAVEYFDPTGYRRIPMSTCEGGLQLDHIVARPCPHKEKEFEKKHPGISGIGLFFAIFFPVAAAAAVGYYAFTRWDGKFGRIRLGESAPESIFSGNSPLVSIPVTIVAGTVAVFTAMPLLFSSLWRSLRGYSRIPRRGGQMPYSSRGAFAARRGDYVGVVDDEDELLGVEEFEGDEEDEV